MPLPAAAAAAASAAKAKAAQMAKDKAKQMAVDKAKDVGRSAVGAEPRGAGGVSSGSNKGGMGARLAAPVGDMAKDAAKKKGLAMGAGATAAAAPAVGKIAFLLMFLNWLKTLFSMLAAALANFWSMFLAFLVAVGKAVVGFFVGVGTAVAGFVGGAVSATVAGAGAFVMFLAGAVGITAAGAAVVQNEEIARHDGSIVDCAEAFQAQTANLTDGTIDAGAQTFANAQLIYSVLAAWGMPDENIAGILGNWDAESGIDATSVEGIFTERFVIGPEKQQAEADDYKGFGYTRPDGSWYGPEYRGIGLAQWTNGRNVTLRSYADAIGQPWHMVETQLGYMISPAEGADAEIVKGMIRESLGSPGEAALYFHDAWERSADTEEMKQRRLEKASSWYAQMGGWEANHTLADSILAQSGTALDGANSAQIRQAALNCVSQRLDVDNSSLATAWVSFAWPYKDDSRHNDGTYLYVWLHDEIFPGDPYYASCDRSVATGVRWSGTDDTFPAGAVEQQLIYVQGSSKWEQVENVESQLLPGDIFIRKDGSVSHIIGFTGTEAPDAVWGPGNHEPNSNIMHGSLSRDNGRSPGLDRTYGGDQGTQTYTVWRNVEAEASSRYSSLVPPASAKPGEGDKSRYHTWGG